MGKVEIMPTLTAEEAEFDRQAWAIMQRALNPAKARQEAAEMVDTGYANDIIRGYTLTDPAGPWRVFSPLCCSLSPHQGGCVPKLRWHPA